MAKKLPKGRKKISVTVALDPRLVKRIDRIAGVKNVSRSELVTSLIQEGIDDEETTAAALSNPTILNALVGAFGQPEVMRAMMNQMRQDVTDEQLGLFSKAMEVARVVVDQPDKKKKVRPAARP
jgi:predicted transcriptional regulator